MIDYKKIAEFNKLSASKAKLALEAYGKELGIDLKRNKSFDKMVQDLEAFVAPQEPKHETVVDIVEETKEIKDPVYTTEMLKAQPTVEFDKEFLKLVSAIKTDSRYVVRYVTPTLKLNWLQASQYVFGVNNDELIQALFDHMKQPNWISARPKDEKFFQELSMLLEVISLCELRLHSPRTGLTHSFTAQGAVPTNVVKRF
ncbi:MAG: hypothetical protein ACRC3J_05465 [Culicoidibacterales bacterium]